LSQDTLHDRLNIHAGATHAEQSLLLERRAERFWALQAQYLLLLGGIIGKERMGEDFGE
jgi:hypothetical protein